MFLSENEFKTTCVSIQCFVNIKLLQDSFMICCVNCPIDNDLSLYGKVILVKKLNLLFCLVI